MSYRKLQIEDKTYEYTIGKSFVKIKDLGVFPKSQIGEKISEDVYSVTPNKLKEFIETRR